VAKRFLESAEQKHEIDGCREGIETKECSICGWRSGRAREPLSTEGWRLVADESSNAEHNDRECIRSVHWCRPRSGHVKSSANKVPEEFKKVADAWWQRAEPLFLHLEGWLHPHFADHLIEALAEWFPHYPVRCLNRIRRLCESGVQMNLLYERLIVGDVIKILQRCLAEHRDLLGSDQPFLQDFAAILEALLVTANAEALGMAASLDEFYR
jgi:hypothetical protein